MIEADLARKCHVPEDVLTSNCIGLMHLLPDAWLIQFLASAKDVDGKELEELASYDQVTDIRFWFRLPCGSEPDVILCLGSSKGLTDLHLIIEAKHGAPKSGRSEDGTAPATAIESNTALVASDDQLARYYLGLRRQQAHVKLIYLTHHRWLPLKCLRESMAAACVTDHFYWLSWHDLYRWAVVQGKVATGTEERILITLKRYLAEKGYRRYLGPLPMLKPVGLQPLFKSVFTPPPP